MKPVIVHGPVSDAGDHAFLPEDLALEALEAWSAYNHARTWREFWQKLPELHRSMLGYPHSTKPEYEGELPRYPDDDTPFDKLLAAGDEGEFPRYAHVQEEAWQWMPEDIRERYGEGKYSLAGDIWFEYPPEQAEAVAEELRRRGYEVRLDPSLVERTCRATAFDAPPHDA